MLAWTGAARAEGARRIVSMAGSLTEIVYALGAEDRLVGVDTTSLHPPSARALPQVGYHRSLSAEGILSLAPDLVLASEAAGPPVVLDQVRSAGVPVRIVTQDLSPDGLDRKIREIAEILGREAEGERLTSQIHVEFARAPLGPSGAAAGCKSRWDAALHRRCQAGVCTLTHRH